MLAGLAGQPLGPVGRDVQPGRDREIGGGLAGPPPGLDGDRLLNQVQVGGDRVEVDRQAQGPAGTMGQDAGHADVAGHPEGGGPRFQLGRHGQGRLRVAAQQRQPPVHQLVLEPQPPAEDQVAGQQGPGLGQPGPGAVRVAGLHALLGQVLQSGDGEFRDALADLPQFQGLQVTIVRRAGHAEAAQHPAGEVDPPAPESRHLAAVDLGRVPGEGVQGQGRAPGHGVRVPGEQQRVQGGRGVGHPLLRAGRRAQQGQRLVGLALVGPEHPQPGRGGHPVGPLGQRERLAEEQLGLGQVTGRVPGPAADGQAAGPDGRVGRGQRAVRGELRGLGEAAVEVAGPRADLQGGGPGGRGELDVGQRLRVPAAAGADPGPFEPGLRLRVQSQGVVQQGLGRGVVEALGGPLGGGPQRPGGQHQVPAQPRVVGDHGRVRVRLAGQYAAGLPVQQGGPAHGGAGGQRLSHQLVLEPEPPAVGGQQLLGRGAFGVVEQVHGQAEQGREQLDVEFRADHRGRAEHGTGRAQLVAARRHRLDQRRGQLGPGAVAGQLGQEQRVALGPLVQLVGAGRPDQFGGGLPAEQAEVDGRGGRQGRALTGADRRHHHGGHVLPPREAQPVGQGVPGQVRVVDHHHQRAPLGQAGHHPDQRRVQHRGAEHAVGQELLGPGVPRSPWRGGGLGGPSRAGR